VRARLGLALRGQFNQLGHVHLHRRWAARQVPFNAVSRLLYEPGQFSTGAAIGVGDEAGRLLLRQAAQRCLLAVGAPAVDGRHPARVGAACRWLVRWAPQSKPARFTCTVASAYLLATTWWPKARARPHEMPGSCRWPATPVGRYGKLSITGIMKRSQLWKDRPLGWHATLVRATKRLAGSIHELGALLGGKCSANSADRFRRQFVDGFGSLVSPARP